MTRKKNLNHRAFQKAKIPLGSYHERKAREKKKSFLNFPCGLLIWGLFCEMELAIVYFFSCMCEVKHQQSVCKWNVTKLLSSFDQAHSSYHVFQQPQQECLCYQSWQWAGTKACLKPVQVNPCNSPSWYQFGLASKVKKLETSCISHTSYTIKGK